MAAYRHTQTEFPWLRSNIYTIVPPPRPAPLAPYLHLTHPVFNPVSPTAHSLNASVARGDTIIEGIFLELSDPMSEGVEIGV